MPHILSMFDRDYIGVWDLEGRDRTLVIESVAAGNLVSQGNRKQKKPIVRFRKAEKGFILNKTNAKIIANLYGFDTTKWVGKAITLYPTTTECGGETVDCIRVRPRIPVAKGAGLKGQPVDEDIRAKQRAALERTDEPQAVEEPAPADESDTNESDEPNEEETP